MSFIGKTPSITPPCIYAMLTHFAPLSSGHLSLARRHILTFIFASQSEFPPG